MNSETPVRMEDLVDLRAYPLDQLETASGEELVQWCQSQLDCHGACVLDGFLKPQAIIDSLAEAERLLPNAHQVDHYFAYDDVDDKTLGKSREELPENHPGRYSSLTKIRFIAQDYISVTNPVMLIHAWPQMSEFIGKVMKMTAAHTSDCPLSGCVFTVAEEYELQDWHFDGADFIVTLMLQDAERGGSFNYAPGLRSQGGEDDYENISQVFSGQSELVQTLSIKPGTLTLFKGKYNLHKAAPVGANSRRVMAILSFADKPGLTGDKEFLKLFYGRSLKDL
ncbi:MAG: hypothetical protein ACI8P9_000109 [Parasphingorhabdus sp.]